MADIKGRCNNLEFCADATSRKLITLRDDVPFLCPKCGEELESVQTTQKAKRNKTVLAVQVLVVLAAGGGIAFKVITSSGDGPTLPAGTLAPLDTSAAPAEPTAAPLAPLLAAPPAQAATAAQTASPVPPPPVVAPTLLVRLAGSSVIGDRLARRLSGGYLSLIGDSDIALYPGSAPDTVVIAGNQAGQHEGIGITGNGSAGGFNALLRGTADVAMTVRPPTAAEIDQLASVGDMTNAANEHVIAVDAVAAITGPANRIASFTKAQLQGIFSGQITDWAQLGAPAGPIHAYAQDSAGGRVDSAADLLAAAPGAGVKLLPTEEAVVAAVVGDRAGVGLVSFNHAGTARVVPVGETGAVPSLPTELAVSTEDYPLTRRLYLYAVGTGGNNFVRRFTDYVASANGQAAVEAAGFVPLTVRKAVAPVATDTASTRLHQVIGNATRVSIDFRFQPGSTELDSRGARDVDRLVSFLKAQHVDGSRLILAGFADSHGSPAANQAVSQKRADTVVAALAKYSVAPGRVVNFGAELPVADNATPEGRERNRRVEVYLAP